MTISIEAQKVQQALKQHNLENPAFFKAGCCCTKKQQIADHMSQVLQIIGLDLTNDSVRNTPKRLANMYLDEVFSGLNYQNFPKITKIANQMQCKEMVLIDHINLNSTCEHHFLPIIGKVAVAYYPENWVLGLSKINRLVKFFAKRPQIQERFTKQVLLAMQTILETENVAVYVKATHCCVTARGIEDTQSNTTTSAFGGIFQTEDKKRLEFLQLIQK